MEYLGVILVTVAVVVYFIVVVIVYYFAVGITILGEDREDETQNELA